ncbi:hypothetical protein [Massilia soli]|uniref:Uncharacterized protein n=1 Tax=Massilia soli TaxID=2792854 RepID=A0ABS7SRA7_9BURK|nr:hypothetical protein [Massilia soli]MBZ2208467.1 hypothetical protein [Massilia soli]
MANTPPTITPPPDGPQRGDRATFAGRVDAFITWLIAAVAQFGALATNVYANAVDAFASATAAGSSASAAAAAAEAAVFAANAPLWVSGTTYSQYQAAMSPLSLQTYRRKTAGAGTTDPSLDSTNWRAIARSSTFDPVAVAALDINLALADYFTKTISTASTLTISNVPSTGASFTLELQLDGGSIALPASVKVANDVMPTLATGKTHMLMFSTKNGGVRWRLTVAPNFVN